MNLGEQIASLRKAKGWTQARLAQEAGLSASAIAMYETNRRHPDRAAMDKLAKALGASLEPVGQPPLDHTTQAAALQAAAAAATSRRSAAESAGLSTDSSDESPAAASKPPSSGLTHLALTREEARFILFLRMNPRSRAFLESYILADERKRQQLEKAWRLIQDFQL
jgi:transcriptional regulator with XRE-family HTH domain